VGNSTSAPIVLESGDQMKDTVTVKANGNVFLKEQTVAVRDGIVQMAKAQSQIVTACIAVGKVMESSPDVGKQFIGMVQGELTAIAFEQGGQKDYLAKLDDTQRSVVIGKVENWPDGPKVIWQQNLGKRFAEIKKIIGNFGKNHTTTMQRLTGPGSVHQKIAALENLTNRGAKKGARGQNTTTTEAAKAETGNGKPADQQAADKGAPPAQVVAVQKQMQDNVLSMVGNLTIPACLDVVQAVAAKIKGNKEHLKDKALATFADTLQGALRAYTEAHAADDADEAPATTKASSKAK